MGRDRAAVSTDDESAAAQSAASLQYLPHDPVDVVTEREGSRDFVRMRWGLAPSWWPKPLKELKAATFNAHGETVAESSGLGHFEHLRGAPVYLHRANSAFFRTAASVRTKRHV
jgi:putative SOS response-associated peptidase YedK